jgi:1,4-alpha-glucan branching enzyme
MMEESVLHEVPFMLAAPDARRVSVVGDFNGWDGKATPLVRDRSGVWTTLVAMPAGRHAYAFLVDDTVLTLDPRAPRTTDPDLGTQHSVLLVGAP